MEFMDKVSKRIVELREAKGETQQELADAIGITRQSLSRYEIAARTINVDVLGALAQHFNVTTDYLLGLSDVKSTEQDMKIACEVTGLSEKAIENVSNSPIFKPDWYKENLLPICCVVLESEGFYNMLRKINRVVSATEWETAFDSNEKEKISKKYGDQSGRYGKYYSLATTKIHLESAKKLFPTGYCIQSFSESTAAAKFDLENEFRKMYENIVNLLVDCEEINKIIQNLGDYDISKYIEKIVILDKSEQEVTDNAQHNPEEE